MFLYLQTIICEEKYTAEIIIKTEINNKYIVYGDHPALINYFH